MRQLCALATTILLLSAGLTAGPAMSGEFGLKSLHGVSLGMEVEDALSILEGQEFVIDRSTPEDPGYIADSAEYLEGNPEFSRNYFLNRDNIELMVVATRDPLVSDARFRVTSIFRVIDFVGAAELVPPDVLDAEFLQRTGADGPTCILDGVDLPVNRFVLDETWKMLDMSPADCERASRFGLNGDDIRYVIYTVADPKDRKDGRVVRYQIGLADAKASAMVHNIDAEMHGLPRATLGDF